MFVHIHDNTFACTCKHLLFELKDPNRIERRLIKTRAILIDFNII